MRRRTITWRLGLGATIALTAGCASLLGDYDGSSGSGDDGGPGDSSNELDGDSASDASDSSRPTGDDGPSTQDSPALETSTLDAADAAPPLLTCTLSLTNPIQIDSLAGGVKAFYDGAPIVMGLGDNTVEIVEMGEAGLYTAYWVDPNNKNLPVQGTLHAGLSDNGGNIVSSRAVSEGYALMQQYDDPGASRGFAISIFTPTQESSTPPALGVSLVPNLPALDNLGVGFTEVTPLDYEWGVAGVGADASAASIYASRTFPDGGGYFHGLVTTTAQTGGMPSFSHVDGKTRIFMSSDPQTGSAVEFSFPDTATDLDGSIPARQLSGGTLPTIVPVGPMDLDGGAAVALLEVKLAAPLSATFHVGTVPSAQLDTFTSSTLPVGAVISSAADLPINNGASFWSPAGFMMAGLGQGSTGGFNLVWHDADGHVRANHVGANAILASHKTLDNVGMALQSQVGTGLAEWYVAWSETQVGADGGVYDVLYVDELTCQ